MTTVAEIRKTVTSILQEYTHLSCYLFGSYAKNTPNEQSDVDILLVFDKEKYEYKQILHLKATIKNAFETNDIYCDPIYGYIQNINNDKAVLYRQYLGYGIHIFGNNLQDLHQNGCRNT
jgi:predicted nucleotidyltransferase